jgi:hypothetical protein
VIRRLFIAVALAVGLGALFVGSIFTASELGGEVVTLTSFDAGGARFHTHLWIVDADGSAWLRAGQPGEGWLARIRSDPHVLVARNGVEGRYLAVPVSDPTTRDRIHALMREKYGWADRYISMIRDGSKSVPVRLDPDAAP